MMKYISTLFIALSATTSAMADNIYGLGGEGTEANPYQIASAEDFSAVAQKITADNTAKGEYFVLLNDIDFGGTAENPFQFPSVGKAAITNITTVAWGFEGVLNGANHTISGIYHTNCANDANGKFNALFSSLGAGGVVRNLVFGADNYVKSYNYVAPFVCINKGGVIENCVNYADIIAADFAACGICGYIVGGSGIVRNCINNGDIVAKTYASGIVAGSQSGKAVGIADADYANVIVNNCTNNGNISTVNGVGSAGIAGAFSGVITNCTNNGDIDDSNGTSASILYTAGIVSCITYLSDVSGNVNNGDVSGGNYVGGIIGGIMKGGDETAEIFGNVNTGIVVGSGEEVSDVVGGSKRSQPIVTGFKNTMTIDTPDDTHCYNLMGQRVNRDAKGVVITNGKKVLNR